MVVRDGILLGLALLTRHFPNATPRDADATRAIVDDYERAVYWTDGDTVLAGFRLALERSGKFAPRYAEVIQCVREAHRRRNVHAQLARPDEEGVVCTACGCRSLLDVSHPTDPAMPARLYPMHRDGCHVRLPKHVA